MFRPFLFSSFTILAGAALLLSSLGTGCSSLRLLRGDETAVVYALGSLSGYPSPLEQKLSPACPALGFAGESYAINGRHRMRLQQIADQWKARPQRFLIVGYTSPDLPPDLARALSERRAQAVRQRLIELGIEAAQIQTVGLGADFAPSSPASNVVVIYQVDSPSTTVPAQETAPAQPDSITEA